MTPDPEIMRLHEIECERLLARGFDFSEVFEMPESHYAPDAIITKGDRTFAVDMGNGKAIVREIAE